VAVPVGMAMAVVIVIRMTVAGMVVVATMVMVIGTHQSSGLARRSALTVGRLARPVAGAMVMVCVGMLSHGMELTRRDDGAAGAPG